MTFEMMTGDRRSSRSLLFGVLGLAVAMAMALGGWNLGQTAQNSGDIRQVSAEIQALVQQIADQQDQWEVRFDEHAGYFSRAVNERFVTLQASIARVESSLATSANNRYARQEALNHRAEELARISALEATARDQAGIVASLKNQCADLKAATRGLSDRIYVLERALTEPDLEALQ